MERPSSKRQKFIEEAYARIVYDALKECGINFVAYLPTAGLLLSEPPSVLHGGEAPTKLFIVHGSMIVSATPARVAKSHEFFCKYVSKSIRRFIMDLGS